MTFQDLIKVPQEGDGHLKPLQAATEHKKEFLQRLSRLLKKRFSGTYQPLQVVDSSFSQGRFFSGPDPFFSNLLGSNSGYVQEYARYARDSPLC